MSTVAGIAQAQFVTGLNQPTKLAFAPDGRLFVSEKTGDLRIVKDGQLLPTPFLTLPVNSDGERGVLGVAFDSGFATDHFVYVYWTATTPTIHNRVSRFTADGDLVVPGSEVDLIDLPTLGPTNHNGGQLGFGPDGMLYISAGENGTPANAQSLDTLLGKILRINADGSIPADNPFLAQTTGVNQAIWAMGLRNPYSFAFDPTTGELLINDVGQDTWEEVDRGVAGANYGWPTTEGPTTDARFASPLYAYQHGANEVNGGAILGAAFDDGPAGASGLPAAYVGNYFFADYVGGYIKSIDLAHGNAVTPFATGLASPTDLKVGPDGALYSTNIGDGTISRFTAAVGVSAGPTVTTSPASQTVMAGQAASFSVAADGTTPFKYQWRRNGKRIAGATASTYSIAATKATDNGAKFDVVVTDSAGGVTTTSPPAVLTVTTQPDLIGTIRGLPVNPVVGGSKQKLTVRVRNAGTGAAVSSAVTVQLFLSLDPAIDDSDMLVGTATKRLNLKPGKTADFGFTVTYPDSIDGNYYVLGNIDATNTVTELIESNNTAQSDTTVAIAHPFVDFSMNLVSVPATVTLGKTTSAVATLLNSGNVTYSGPLGLAVYFSTDSTGSAGAMTAANVSPRVTLKPNRIQKIRIKFAAPAGEPAGPYFLSAAVDPSNLIAEDNDADNFAVSANAFQLK